MQACECSYDLWIPVCVIKSCICPVNVPCLTIDVMLRSSMFINQSSLHASLCVFISVCCVVLCGRSVLLYANRKHNAGPHNIKHTLLRKMNC